MPSFRNDRQMFLAMHGQPSEIEGFLFVLAEKLGKSVAEVMQFPALEIMQWRSYYTVKHQAEQLAGGGVTL